MVTGRSGERDPAGPVLRRRRHRPGRRTPDRVRRRISRQRLQGRCRGATLPTVDRPASWHSLSPTTDLTARDQATVVLDRGVLTTFGGFGAGTVPGTVAVGTHLADTWQRPIGGRGPWQLVTPLRVEAVPIAREGPAFALDPVRHRLVLFGGLNGDTTLADVWTADLSRPGRPRWSQLCAPNGTVSCGTGPTARWGSHAVYDPDGNRFIVFGGSTGTGTSTNDVWALDLRGQPTWHELVVEGPRPAARWSAASGFDPVRRRLVVFGGQTGPDASGGTTLHDTWALSLDGTPKWTQLAVTGPQPAPRRSPAGAVRVSRNGTQLLVAMGLTTTAGTHHARRVVARPRQRRRGLGPARQRTTHQRWHRRHAARPPVSTHRARDPPPRRIRPRREPRSPTKSGRSACGTTPGPDCPAEPWRRPASSWGIPRWVRNGPDASPSLRRQRLREGPPRCRGSGQRLAWP